MKKIISTLLIVILIMVQLIPIINVKAEEAGTLTITTYGENGDGINPKLVTNKANLTVNHITNGDEFSAYKIIDVFYNEQTNEMTYDFTSQFRTFLDQTENYGQTFTIENYFELTSDSLSHYGNVITTSTLNVLVSKYTTYIRKNSIKSDYDLVTVDADVNSDFYKATAEVVAGSYLILPKNIFQFSVDSDIPFSSWNRINLYGVMVGNVVFNTQNDRFWNLPDVFIEPKTEDVGINSYVYNFNSLEYFAFQKGENVSIDMNAYSILSLKHGEMKLFFTDITKTAIPINSINKSFRVEIDIPNGIDYNPKIYFGFGSELIEIVDNKLVDSDGNTICTLNLSKEKIVATLDIEKVYSFVTSAFTFGFAIDISLNDSAKVGDSGNVLTSNLIIPDDLYVDGEFTTLTDNITITTYGLELTNLSKEDSTLLKGAKYEIYSKYTDSVLSNKIGEFTVGDDGKGSFPGVPSGTVYLKQVKAPTGYQLIKEPIAVKIATEDAIVGTQEGYYQVIVRNDAMWYLPSTGGVGTILYTLIGLVIVGVSAAVIVYYRKKKIKA